MGKVQNTHRKVAAGPIDGTIDGPSDGPVQQDFTKMIITFYLNMGFLKNLWCWKAD